jgi:hypothetical protein
LVFAERIAELPKHGRNNGKKNGAIRKQRPTWAWLEQWPTDDQRIASRRAWQNAVNLKLRHRLLAS